MKIIYEILYWYGHSDSSSPQSMSAFSNSFNSMVPVTSLTISTDSVTGGGGAG